MHSALLIFIIASIITGTIFLVALFELIFTVKRRKVQDELQTKVHQLKTTYNESINKMVVEEDGKLEEAEKEVAAAADQAKIEKEHLEESYKEQLEEATHDSKAAMERAKARAHKLEEEARMKADEYVANRQQEVEEELMDLVMHVTKKVLPQGLTYEGHKDLVLSALRDIKVAKEK